MGSTGVVESPAVVTRRLRARPCPGCFGCGSESSTESSRCSVSTGFARLGSRTIFATGMSRIATGASAVTGFSWRARREAGRFSAGRFPASDAAAAGSATSTTPEPTAAARAARSARSARPRPRHPSTGPAIGLLVVGCAALDGSVADCSCVACSALDCSPLPWRPRRPRRDDLRSPAAAVGRRRLGGVGLRLRLGGLGDDGSGCGVLLVRVQGRRRDHGEGVLRVLGDRRACRCPPWLHPSAPTTAPLGADWPPPRRRLLDPAMAGCGVCCCWR